MILQTHPSVPEKFDSYPPQVAEKLHILRNLVLKTAEEIPYLDSLEETLKWGEPSYLTKYGSTIRMDWKEKNPDHFAMYFKCTSQLVPTFRVLFPDTFTFEGNRALLFKLNEPIPQKDLSQCIRMALQYHKLKNKPLLGA